MIDERSEVRTENATLVTGVMPRAVREALAPAVRVRYNRESEPKANDERITTITEKVKARNESDQSTD